MVMAIWDALVEDYGNQSYSRMDWLLGYSTVEKLLGIVAGKRVLDYGCGPGKFSRTLSDLGALVTGVDISEKALEIASSKSHSSYYCLVDDLSGYFDYAVAAFVLCTIPEKQDFERVIQTIYDHLLPNGSFIVLEPHPDSGGYDFTGMKREKPAKLISGMPIKVELSGMNSFFYDFWHSKNDYTSALERAGFRIDVIVEQPGVGDSWKDERKQPPHLIIKAMKAINI